MSYLNPALVRNLTPEELLSYVDRSDPVVLRLAELAEYGIDVVEELEEQLASKDEEIEELNEQLASKDEEIEELNEQLASKDEEIEELNEQLARATALCNQYYLGESHV